MPRLMTSMPAARLSATRRSSSANMYAGTASSRRDGRTRCALDVPGVIIGPEAYSGSQVLERGRELRRELAREDGQGVAGEPHVEIGAHVDGQLAAVEGDGERAGGAT